MSSLSTSKALAFTQILGLIIDGKGRSDVGYFGFAYWFSIRNERIRGVRSVRGQLQVAVLSIHAFFIEGDGKCLEFSECEFIS